MHARTRNLRDAVCRISLFALSCAPHVPSVLAQGTNGSIYGTVTDFSGAVIPAATLTATNVLTSASKTTTTNASGEYNFPVLDPGDYKVVVQMTSYQSETQENIRLDSSQNVHVSFALQAGSIEQNMTVEALTALVDTRESQVGGTIDQKRIQDLPLNGRNAYDLVQTVPGVTNYIPDVPTGSRAGAQFTINGISRNTAFYLDGTYNTDIQLGGNLLPNPDALHELRILTSNFDAEYGRLAGGVVNAITRSGTNRYHGLAYDYLRNNVFNAKNWFLTSVTPLRQNQFGGNFGGPIPRVDDHGFFFASYQALRTRQPANVASSSLITPTALERIGDFSNTPAALRPNVYWPNISCGGQYTICPGLLDPVAQNALKLVPVGDSTFGPNYGHPAEQAADGNINVDQVMARVDYQLGENHQLSAMYFQSRGTANSPTAGGNQILNYSGMQNYEGQYNAVVSDTWTISSAKVNSVRAYYSLNHYVVDNTYRNQHLLPDLGSQAAMGSNNSTQPRFSVAGYWQMGSTQTGPVNTATSTLGISDTFNWVLGHHELKLGGAYPWVRVDGTGVGVSNGSFAFIGSVTGNALVDFLAGRASLTQNNGVFVRTHSPDPSLFVQDNWRLTRRFSVNLGLRWEYYPPQAGQNSTGTFVAGVQSTRFPTAPLGLLTSGDQGIPDGILHTPWNTFAPRFGFAYDLFGNGLASLRGAYGIFYSALDQGGFGLVQQPFSRSVTISRTPNLVTPFAPDPDPFPYVASPSNAVFLSGANIFSLPPGVNNISSLQQFSFGVQQQYRSKWSTEINYVGNLARHLYITFDENSPIYNASCTTATCSTSAGQNKRRPYQPPGSYTYASISLSAPVANSSYHSLQATLARRFERRFSIQACFVWSKVIGYGALTNAYDLRSSWGLLDINVPYNFAASYIYVAPEVHRLGLFGRSLLSGWQLNGITILRSGQPFNVTSGTDTNFDGTNNDRPNVIGNPYLPAGRGRVATTKAFFNTSAFVTPPAGTPYGNASFNMLYGPGYVDIDLSAFKTFSIYKKSSLQFRGEVFNLLNNVNLSAPNGTLSSPAFGTISGAGAPRIVQLALRLSF